MTSYRISADIGGTFTDLVVEPSGGAVFVGKVATTPDDPARGVVQGLVELLGDLSGVSFFVHGTTVGLNAFLERKGKRVLLLTTAGHRDGYTIARGNRRALYELRYRKPEPLVPRRDVHEIRGRLSWNGEVVERLHEQDFDTVIDKVKAEGMRAVAVCFLHAFAFPEHEIQAGRILRAALPGVSVSLSHEVAREWREYERASSAVMNAYISPVVQRYLESLEAELASRGMAATVHVMQSNGGIISASAARRNPVFTLLSGPVGGTIAGTSLAARLSRQNLLCIDMGGTSFDLSLVIDGMANTTRESELDGLPLLMSSIDIQTIGTGGGSVAWLENGAVRVGPHSAGAFPGPACYGRGGTDPTVTDANLYLNRLGERSLLGGDMALDRSPCNQAIDRVARQAGLEPLVFAEGILAISNAAMADAMRTITVSQGVDPRKFTLVAFGGAGPMVAAYLADELEISNVLIPRFPGTFSAWGMLQTDLRQDFSRSFFHPARCVDEPALAAVYSGLEVEGASALARDGVDSKNLAYQKSADMRYVGQEYTINVPVSEPLALDVMIDSFHAAYQRRYGHSSPLADVEFVILRVAALGALARHHEPHLRDATSETAAAPGERQAIFQGVPYATPVLSRDRLPASFQCNGPVIVEEQSATTVVPPGWRLALDGNANLLLHKGEST